MSDMTRENAIKILEFEKQGVFKSLATKETLTMAISALSADGEYIKKSDAISKILIEFTERECNGKVMCACADVKQTCADILDGLPTYSFPNSADDNTMEWITKNGCFGYSLRCSKCDTEVINESNFCPNCGRKAVNK